MAKAAPAPLDANLLGMPKTAPDATGDPIGSRFAQIVARRQQEADEFYQALALLGHF